MTQRTPPFRETHKVVGECGGIGGGWRKRPCMRPFLCILARVHETSSIFTPRRGFLIIACLYHSSNIFPWGSGHLVEFFKKARFPKKTAIYIRFANRHGGKEVRWILSKMKGFGAFWYTGPPKILIVSIFGKPAENKGFRHFSNFRAPIFGNTLKN